MLTSHLLAKHPKPSKKPSGIFLWLSQPSLFGGPSNCSHPGRPSAKSSDGRPPIGRPWTLRPSWAGLGPRGAQAPSAGSLRELLWGEGWHSANLGWSPFVDLRFPRLAF